MPDVIIKGMEMPRCCASCDFRHTTYGLNRYVCIANGMKELDVNLDTGRDDRCPLRPAPEWISVEERLPEPKYAVLGYAPRYGNIFAVYYDSVCGWMVWSPISDEILPASQGEITHWMPLPEPYREEGDNVRSD